MPCKYSWSLIENLMFFVCLSFSIENVDLFTGATDFILAKALIYNFELVEA